MKKIIFVLVVALLFNLSLVNAITEQEIKEAKSLIDSKIDCENLSDSQLEIIGGYYMEQMHPGEAHELMHKMMGLQEGSEDEEQFHINMAKTMYCGESGMMGSSGMMNMMMGNNIMGSQNPQTDTMQGMMNGQNWQGSIMGNWGYWNFINILYIILLIGLIVLVYLL